MRDTEELIARIVSLSKIPSQRRRQEVVRELRAHLEDSMRAAPQGDQIDQLALANFGDPDEIAREFASVYKSDWTVRRISVFLLSTLTIATLVSAATLAMQAAVAIGFGVPLEKMFAGRHTAIEILDIASTVACYLGLISMEKLFYRRSLPKAIAVLALMIAIVTAGGATANVHAPFLVFGFATSVFLRAAQTLITNGSARIALITLCFALAGLASFQLRPGMLTRAIAVTCASWLVMGAGYQLMTKVAARIEAAWLECLQWI